MKTKFGYVLALTGSLLGFGTGLAAAEYAHIYGIGILHVFADTTAESETRCRGAEVPFSSGLIADSQDFSGSLFSEAFGFVPETPSLPVLVRRGARLEREGDEGISARFSAGFSPNAELLDPEFDITLDAEVMGCARFGGLRVTDIRLALAGEVRHYRLDNEVRFESARAEGFYTYYQWDSPLVSSVPDADLIYGNRYEDQYALPYSDEHLGALEIHARTQQHSFAAVDGIGAAIEGSWWLTLRVVLLDAGLSVR